MEETREVILVITGGWVLYGLQSLADPTKVHRARVIIRWGTTEGLAELALHGPQKDTTLGAICEAEVPASHVVFTLLCTSGHSKWAE